MKIVLTGGPSAGKTSTVELLFRGYAKKLCVVQEAASLLYRGGFPRESGVEHQKCQQRAIYHVQKELENIAQLDGRNLICDRGSLDGLAYWPGDEKTFFQSINSTMERELLRYDWVIHLDTVPSYDYQATSLRTETNEQALAINERIKLAWRLHPQRFIIHDSCEFILKMNLAIKIVEMIFQGYEYGQINEAISTGVLDIPFSPLRTELP